MKLVPPSHLHAHKQRCYYTQTTCAKRCVTDIRRAVLLLGQATPSHGNSVPMVLTDNMKSVIVMIDVFPFLQRQPVARGLLGRSMTTIVKMLDLWQ